MYFKILKKYKRKENETMNEIVVGVIGLVGTLSSICFAYLAFLSLIHI